MATARTTPAKRPAGTKRAPVLPENHTPSQAAAYAIVEEFRYLEPSVNRIMEADLSEAGRLHGLELFRTSLGVPGDPNRIPANAVAAARAFDGNSPIAG
jgi:hypothetical protein